MLHWPKIKQKGKHMPKDKFGPKKAKETAAFARKIESNANHPNRFIVTTVGGRVQDRWNEIWWGAFQGWVRVTCYPRPI